MEESERASMRKALQDAICAAKNWPRKPDPKLTVEPKPHGWLLPMLLEIETVCWGRWEHWTKLKEAGNVIDEPIPQIQFDPHEASLARKMHENALNSIVRHGDWRGWSGWENFNYYLDWLLYALGHPGQPDLPSEPQTGAFGRLYQTFCLEAMIAWPADIFGDLLADNAHGKHAGFYPTPHPISEMMARMLMAGEDCRLQTVCDPCVGTGRMLLHASNHSYRLYAQDIDVTVIKAALVNGYCFAPWLVRPLFDYDAPPSAELSDQMTAQAPTPQAAQYLEDTEHDSEQQYRFEPVKKRRKKDDPQIEQGLLFRRLPNMRER